MKTKLLAGRERGTEPTRGQSADEAAHSKELIAVSADPLVEPKQSYAEDETREGV
jgi:hypothetical protein